MAGFEELLQMSDGDKTRLIADVTINQKNRNKCAMNKNKENIQVYSNIVVSLVLVYIKLHIKIHCSVGESINKKHWQHVLKFY